jgi:serine/threonine protein kinase
MSSSYRLGPDLGSGAFARVVKATDACGREVAIKILPTVSEALRNRAIAEASLHARLSHPGIVAFVESFEVGADYWIVLECVDGRPLSRWHALFATRPPDEHEVIAVFAQVLQAVGYLHDNCVCHRDLKPANIFLTASNGVKLGDFGSAEECPRGCCSVSAVPAGTVGFIAPEVLNGEPASPASDVFSLGCVLLELCLCRDSTSGCRGLVKGGLPEVPRRFTPTFRRLVQSMLQLEPERRPTVREITRLPLFQWADVGVDLPGVALSVEQESSTAITDAEWDELKAVRQTAHSVGRGSAAAIEKLAAMIARRIGNARFETVRYHVMNEFEDMNSAEFVREYGEEHEDHVRMIRELMLLEEEVALAM